MINWLKNSSDEAVPKVEAVAAPDVTTLDNAGLLALITDSSSTPALREAALARLQQDADIKQVAKWAADHDKRLYRQANARLTQQREQQHALKNAQDLLEQFQQLHDNSLLPLNRLAELDHAWNALETHLHDTASRAQHASLRSTIEQRVIARTQLQQNASGLRNQLEALRIDIDSAGKIRLETLAQSVEDISQQLVKVVAHAEISALTSSQLNALDDALQAARGALEQRAAHLAKPSEEIVAPAPSPEKTAPAIDANEVKQMLEQLQQALSEGHIDAALERESQISARVKGHVIDPKLHAQLKRAHAELARLKGWERFGVDVVRDGLIEEALALPNNGLSVEALGNAVRELRERWKTLDTQAGAGAPVPVWKRFNQACETAYQPVANWLNEQTALKTQLVEEAENLAQTFEAQVAENSADRSAENAIEWKKIASQIDSLRHRWRNTARHGHRALLQRFDTALLRLQQPLDAHYQREQQAREALIQRAKTLLQDPKAHFGKLRTLQQDWQTRAKNVSLPKSKEQSLWQEFRSTCDAAAEKMKQGLNAEREREESVQRERAAKQQQAQTSFETALQKVLLAAQLAGDASLRAQWDALGSAGVLEAALKARVDAALPLEATFNDRLIELEIEAGLPSNGHETRRRELQIAMLARKMKGGGSADDSLALLQNLLRQNFDLEQAQRLVNVLRAKPQWLKLRSERSGERSERTPQR